MSTPYRQPLRPGASWWERRLADVANHGPGPAPDPGPEAEPVVEARMPREVRCLHVLFAVVWVLFSADEGPGWVWPVAAVVSVAAIAGASWASRVADPEAEEWKIVHRPVIAVLLAIAAVLYFRSDVGDSTPIYGLFVVAAPLDEMLRGVRTRRSARCPPAAYGPAPSSRNASVAASRDPSKPGT